MADGDSVTVTEAAAMLGVRKEKIARLIKQGILTSRPSKLDARRRLIPRAQVEKILQEEGHNPPKKRTTTNRELPTRPRPRTAGMYTGPVKIHSDEVEDYLREHWHPS